MNDRELAPRQQELLDLLEDPGLSASEIQDRMEISKAWMYQLRERLTARGVFYPAEDLEDSPVASAAHTLVHPQDTMANPAHAAVRHSCWRDHSGRWDVQGALLDRWDHRSWPDVLPDQRAIVVRWEHAEATSAQYWAWVASRRSRATIRQTARHFLPGQLTPGQLARLTSEVAWALAVDVVLSPEGGLPDETP